MSRKGLQQKYEKPFFFEQKHEPYNSVFMSDEAHSFTEQMKAKRISKKKRKK